MLGHLDLSQSLFRFRFRALASDGSVIRDPGSPLVARVVRPGGRFAFFLNHPLLQTPDSGWIDDHMVDPPEQYWQLGWYLETITTVEEVDPGVFITFHHRTLAEYLNCARGHGLVLGHMEEPAPPPGFIAKAPEYTEQARMPRVMFMRLERLS